VVNDGFDISNIGYGRRAINYRWFWKLIICTRGECNEKEEG
ncbi:MAG: hypothetical protein ACI9VN_002585, partial [Patescibacteria group bacterium]